MLERKTCSHLSSVGSLYISTATTFAYNNHTNRLIQTQTTYTTNFKLYELTTTQKHQTIHTTVKSATDESETFSRLAILRVNNLRARIMTHQLIVYTYYYQKPELNIFNFSPYRVYALNLYPYLKFKYMYLNNF